MSGRKKFGIRFFCLIAITVVSIIAFIARSYSDNNNHYIISIEKNIAQSNNENMNIKESVTTTDAVNLHYTGSLKYEENTKNQIAIVLDNSSSM